MGTITLVAVHVEIDPFLISSMRSSERALKSANLPNNIPAIVFSIADPLQLIV